MTALPPPHCSSHMYPDQLHAAVRGDLRSRSIQQQQQQHADRQLDKLIQAGLIAPQSIKANNSSSSSRKKVVEFESTGVKESSTAPPSAYPSAIRHSHAVCYQQYR